MAQHALKANMTRGEISPTAHARQDIELYQGALAELRNFTVLKHGGIRRRSGTRFVGTAKYTDRVSRFIPFAYDTSQAYQIELGHQYIRFWSVQQRGLILSGGIPYELVSLYTEDQLEEIQFLKINNIIYFVHPDVPAQRLVRNTHSNWTLSTVEFKDGPYFPINDTAITAKLSIAPVELSNNTITFSSATEINNGAGFTVADVGRYIRIQTNGYWNVYKVTGYVSNVSVNVYPYDCAFVPVDAAALYTASTGAPVNGNLVSITYTNVVDIWFGTRGFDSSDVGKFVFITIGAGSGTVRITRVFGPTFIEVQWDNAIDFTLATTSWRLSSLSHTRPDMYPSTINYFEDRLVWGTSTERPRAMGLSMSGLYETFSPSEPDGTVRADNGMWIEIAKSDPILWLQEAPRLQVGTATAIRTVGAADITQVLTPDNIQQRLELNVGTTDIQPITVGSSTLFVGRSDQRIHDLFYDFQTNSLTAPNIAVMADHIMARKIGQVAYQDVPESILWLRTNDGLLHGTTFDKGEKVIGFHTHPFNNGFVESISPTPTAERDELWMIVKRTVVGADIRCVEILEKPFEYNTLENAFYVDSGVTYDGAPTNTLTGLTWLEGIEVDILADGAVLPRQTVVGGAVTFPDGRTPSLVHLGIPITATAKLLRAPIQTQDGVLFGRRARVVGVDVDVLDTAALSVVSDVGKSEAVRYRSAADLMGSPPPMLTGIQRVNLESSWQSGGVFSLECLTPLPATIRGMLIHIDSEP